jgi:hypothetical protein
MAGFAEAETMSDDGRRKEKRREVVEDLKCCRRVAISQPYELELVKGGWDAQIWGSMIGFTNVWLQQCTRCDDWTGLS